VEEGMDDEDQRGKGEGGAGKGKGLDCEWSHCQKASFTGRLGCAWRRCGVWLLEWIHPLIRVALLRALSPCCCSPAARAPSSTICPCRRAKCAAQNDEAAGPSSRDFLRAPFCTEGSFDLFFPVSFSCISFICLCICIASTNILLLCCSMLATGVITRASDVSHGRFRAKSGEGLARQV